MRTFLILCLASLLAGCAATPPKRATPRARVPQVLPPLPPGFKVGTPSAATTAPAARFAPASSEPTVTPGTGIMTAPEIYKDEEFGNLFLARAYQGPNTELLVERTTDLGTYFTVAVFGCWGTEQVFLITTTGQPKFLALRGRHTPCTPGFQPASAARLGMVHTFKTRRGHVKAAKVEGIDVAEGFSVWKVLP